MPNNRNRGHAFERWCKNHLSKWFPFLITTREGSRDLDAKKVDLMYPLDKYGELPFHFQCKTTTKWLNLLDIIPHMPTDKLRAIIHKKTKKANKNMQQEGLYVYMPWEDFTKILDKLYGNGETNGMGNASRNTTSTHTKREERTIP